MYGWLWSLLPSPFWFRVVSAAILVALTLAFLFFTVFPWLELYVLVDSPVMTQP